MCHNKIYISLLIIFSCGGYLCFPQQLLKKIVADITEYDRKEKVIKFNNNVKIELNRGKIFCDKASYSEKDKIINCESNVYAVIISTKDNSSIEIFSNFAKYKQRERELEFYGNPCVIYKSSDGVQRNELRAERLLLEEKKEKITCINNVHLKNSEGEMFCNIAEYFVAEKVILMNNIPILAGNNRVIFKSKKENLNIKTFSSDSAIFYIEQNKFQLNGNVEVVFYPDSSL